MGQFLNPVQSKGIKNTGAEFAFILQENMTLYIS